MTMPEDTKEPSVAQLAAASEFYNRQGYDFGVDNVDIVRILAEFAAQAVSQERDRWLTLGEIERFRGLLEVHSDYPHPNDASLLRKLSHLRDHI